MADVLNEESVVEIPQNEENVNEEAAEERREEEIIDALDNADTPEEVE